MANSYYIIVALVAVVIMQSMVSYVRSQPSGEFETPLAKRRRISIERLRDSGRLRRIYKKAENDGLQEFDGGYVDDDEVIVPAELIEFLADLNAVDRLKEINYDSEKRAGPRRKNGWLSGVFGKRSLLVRQVRNIPQTFNSGDYFGKRFTDADSPAMMNWKRAYNNEDDVTNDLVD